MLIDHVSLLSADIAQTGRWLREEHGLVLETEAYLPLAGTLMHAVWLLPPQSVEYHSVVDRAVAEQTEAGQRVLAQEGEEGALFAWCVLVEELEAVSDRLGLPIFDYTIPHGDGTLRGWRAVSGPPHLPFFIDYPNNGDRAGRIRDRYATANHASKPTHFTELTVCGSARELGDWLGPHDLPLRLVRGGRPGIRAARVATAWGEVSFT